MACTYYIGEQDFTEKQFRDHLKKELDNYIDKGLVDLNKIYVTPKAKKNATNQKPIEESVSSERENGNQKRNETETGSSGSVQRTTPSKEEVKKKNQHNTLVSLVKEYNNTPANKKTRIAELMSQIRSGVNALGYSIKPKEREGEKLVVLSKHGKPIIKVAERTDLPTPTDKQLDYLKSIASIFGRGDTDQWKIDSNSLGMTTAEIDKAVKDLKNNKISAPVKKLADAMGIYGDKHTIEITRGSGANVEKSIMHINPAEVETKVHDTLDKLGLLKTTQAEDGIFETINIKDLQELVKDENKLIELGVDKDKIEEFKKLLNEHNTAITKRESNGYENISETDNVSKPNAEEKITEEEWVAPWDEPIAKEVVPQKELVNVTKGDKVTFTNDKGEQVKGYVLAKAAKGGYIVHDYDTKKSVVVKEENVNSNDSNKVSSAFRKAADDINKTNNIAFSTPISPKTIAKGMELLADAIDSGVELAKAIKDIAAKLYNENNEGKHKLSQFEKDLSLASGIISKNLEAKKFGFKNIDELTNSVNKRLGTSYKPTDIIPLSEIKEVQKQRFLEGKSNKSSLTIDDINDWIEQGVSVNKILEEVLPQKEKQFTDQFKKNNPNATEKEVKDYVSDKIAKYEDTIKKYATKNVTENIDYSAGVKREKRKIKVDEMAALKSQLKAEAQAALEGAKKERKRNEWFGDVVASFVATNEAKGKLTANQALSLTKRAAEVVTDRQMEKFLEYADRVISDSNYVEQIKEIRKNQSGANSRTHGNRSNIVKDFISVNPNDLPTEILPEYEQALKLINQKIPDYSGMVKIYEKITSLTKEPIEFNNIDEVNQASSKLKELLSSNINNIDDYYKAIRLANSIEKSAKKLYQEETIDRQTYNDIVNEIKGNESGLSSKFKTEIDDVKKGIVSNIKKITPDTSNLSEPEKQLIQRYNEYKRDGLLENLSIPELEDLQQIIDRTQQGYVPIVLTDMLNKANAIHVEPELSKAVNESKSPLLSKPLDAKRRLNEKEASTIYKILGYKQGEAFDSALFNPIYRLLTQSHRDINNSLVKLRTATKDFGLLGKKERKEANLKVHALLNMVQTYLGDAPLDFLTYSDNPKEIEKYYSNDAKKMNTHLSKENSYYEDKNKKVLNDFYNKLKSKYTSDNGETLDLEKLHNDIVSGNWSMLTPKEQKLAKTLSEIYADTNNKQAAAAELDGKDYKGVQFYAPRNIINLGRKVVADANTFTKPRIKSSHRFERVDEMPRALDFNAEKSAIDVIKQANRDYYTSLANKQANATLNELEAKNNFNNTAVQSIRDNLNSRIEMEYEKSNVNGLAKSIIQGTKFGALVPGLPKFAGEMVSSMFSAPLRSNTGKEGVKTLFSKADHDFTNQLLRDTDSSLSLGTYNKTLEAGEGVNLVNPLKRFAIAFASAPEHFVLSSAWLPTFKERYKELSGQDFDAAKYKNDADYRDENARNIRDAASKADVVTKQIIGAGLKSEGRENIRLLPEILSKNASVKRNSLAGETLGFLSGYTQREAEQFLYGTKELVSGIRDKNKAEALGGVNKMSGILGGMVLFGSIKAAGNAIQNYYLASDEDEKQEALNQLNSVANPKNIVGELGTNIAQLGASRYAGAGRMATTLAVTAYYMGLKDEDQKSKLAQWSMQNLGTRPLSFNAGQELKTAEQISGWLYTPMPQLLDNVMTTGRDINSIVKDINENGYDAVSQDDKDKLKAVQAIYNSINLMLITKGIGSPFHYQVDKILKKKIRNTESSF